MEAIVITGLCLLDFGYGDIIVKNRGVACSHVEQI